MSPKKTPARGVSTCRVAPCGRLLRGRLLRGRLLRGVFFAASSSRRLLRGVFFAGVFFVGLFFVGLFFAGFGASSIFDRSPSWLGVPLASVLAASVLIAGTLTRA
jgi:hypothetical protein